MNTSHKHIIRLRDPWQQQVLPESTRFVRGFGCPTGLEESDQVFIVIQSIGAELHKNQASGGPAHGVEKNQREAIITLNSQLLGSISSDSLPAVFDVKALLKQRNELGIEIQTPRGQGAETHPRLQSFLGEVHLEISSSAE